jgi:uncharacterized protein (DUF1810 family)
MVFSADILLYDDFICSLLYLLSKASLDNTSAYMQSTALEKSDCHNALSSIQKFLIGTLQGVINQDSFTSSCWFFLSASNQDHKVSALTVSFLKETLLVISYLIQA